MRPFFVLLCGYFPLLLSAQLHFEHAFNTAPADVNHRGAAVIDNQLYCSANDGYFGFELWRFDPGSAAATRLTDLRALGGDASPQDIVAYDDAVYFTARTDAAGRQIFRYEPGNNALIPAWETLPPVANAFNLVAADEELYYVGIGPNGRTLYHYDAATQTSDTLVPPADLPAFQFPRLRKAIGTEEFFLSDRRPDNTQGLWRYDPAAENFVNLPLQLDQPGESWTLNRIVACGDALLISIQYNSLHRWGRYLPAQDSLDLFHVDNSADFLGSACVNDEFWFSNNAIEGIGIYNSVTETVSYLRDRYTAAPDWGRFVHPYGGKIYFKSTLGIDQGVYTFDPATENIERLDYMDGVDPDLYTLTQSGNTLYAYGDNDAQREIFRYDPAGAPELWADINQADKDGLLANITGRFHRYRNRYFFNATSANRTEVWSLDTLTNAVMRLGDEMDIEGRAFMATLSTATVADRFYFSGELRQDGLRQLVSFQPGEDSLRLELSIPSNTQFPPYFGSFIVVGEDIYFSGPRDYPFSNQLFRYSTVTGEYEQVPGTEALTGTASLLLGDHLLFTGSDPDDPFDNAYYSVNLVDSTLIQFSSPDLNYRSFSDLRRLGDRVVYNVQVPGTQQYYLEIYDPTLQEKTTVLPAGFAAIEMDGAATRNGQLWFFYDERYLFTLDAATSACTLAYDFSQTDATPKGNPVWYNDQLYFAAASTAHGRELFTYDPVTDTVTLIADILPGGGGSAPEDFHLINNRLYFSADDGIRGHELWSYGTCFSVTAQAVSDSLGQSAGRIELTTSGGTAPFTYTWNTGATGAVLTDLPAGYYTAEITDATGCAATVSVLLSGGLLPTSTLVIPDVPAALLVYPNPASTQVHLRTAAPELSSMHFELYTAMGRLVRRGRLAGGVATVAIEGLPNGLYFVRGLQAGAEAVPLVIER